MRRIKKLIIKKEETISGRRNDIVRVTEFKVKPVFPKTGQAVTIKMEIQNVSSKTLKCVPWQIIKDKQILDTGSRFNLKAGDKFNVSVTWTAAPGMHFIYGDVDPENVLREPKTKQFNNSPQGVDVRVS